MTKISIAVHHQLSLDEALTRIKNLLHQVKEEHKDKITDLQEGWAEYTGKFRFAYFGMPFSGTIAVEPNQVKLEGTIPLLVAMFQSKIEETIRRETEKLLTAN
jgi:hypothetical protein